MTDNALVAQLEGNNVEVNAMDVACLWTLAKAMATAADKAQAPITSRQQAALDRIQNVMETLFPASPTDSKVFPDEPPK